MEEILRYVLLHSARKRELSVAIPLAVESTSLGQRLLALRQADDSRDAMLEAVAQFLQGGGFNREPARLPLYASLLRFERDIKAATASTVPEWAAVAEHAFGRRAEDVRSSPEFGRLRTQLTEGILALKLASGPDRGLLAEYVRLLRLVDLVDRIAAGDKSLAGQSARSLLGRTVRLPSSLFPLPRRHDQPSPAALKQDRDRERSVATLTATIDDTRTAMGELRDARARSGPAAGSAVPTPEIVDRLSTTTRNVLAGRTLDLATMPLDTAIGFLAADSRRLAAQLHALEHPRASTSMIRIGGTTLPSLLPGGTALGDLAVPDAPKVPTSVGEVRPSGIGSLLVVMQQIKRYEAGEISDTQNFLAREMRQRDTRRLTRREESLTTEVETKTEEERNSQSTKRHEMKQEAEDTIKEDERFKLGATISAGYGKIFQSEVSTEFETSSSEENKDRTAASVAQEVIERAASKVSERVRTEHTVRTLEEFEEKYSHGFDNTAGTEHVIGIYQWLDRIYEVQVYDYGIRLFFDVMVPEPAAFLLQALEETRAASEKLHRPPKFDLRPEDIDENEAGSGTYWQELAARYGVTGLEPPPPETVTFSWSITLPAEGEPQPADTESQLMKSSANLTVPDGYRTETASFEISRQTILGGNAFLHLHFGGAQVVRFNFDEPMPPDEAGPHTDALVAAPIPHHTGTFAIGIYGQSINQLLLMVQVLCNRLPSHYQAWQIRTHAAILTAYQGLEIAYQEQIASANVQQSGQGEGFNPGENRLIERAELKRAAISTITGQYFDKFGAILESATREPRIDFDEAAAEGNYARFFEQAFEWENMTYELYPYYWGRRSTWVNRLLTRDVDPLHAEFLKAGYARLRVPVRPDFELGVFHYLETGEAWDGGELPNLTTDEYIALLEDLKERRDTFMTRIAVGEPWDIRLPTTLVRLKPTPALPEWMRDEDGNWLPVPEPAPPPPPPEDPDNP